MVDSQTPHPPEPLSASSGRDQVRLLARADSPLTELAVFDGRFREVTRGLGQIDLSLPTGLYKVEFRIGNMAVSRHIALMGEVSEVTVALKDSELLIPTAAPLRYSSTEPEEDLVSAVDLLSRSCPPPQSRPCAQILVFLRDPERRGRNLVKLVKTLGLYDSSGEIADNRVDLDAGKGWAGALFEIDPGAYRLRAAGPLRRVFEQALAACDGWQTQIFLTCRDTEDPTPTVDLFHGSMYLARIGRGFDHSRPQLRWVEQARLGLAQGGDILSGLPRDTVQPGGWDLRSPLRFAATDPMLLLLWIYLLLRRPSPDLALIRDAIKMLRKELGDLPDLRALNAWLAPEGWGAPHCDDPPMVLDGWKAATEATKSHAYIMTTADLSARLAGQIWGPGPWLIWEYSSELDNHRRQRSTGTRPGSDVETEARTIITICAMDEWRPTSTDYVRGLKNVNRVQAELLGYCQEFVRLRLDPDYRALARFPEPLASGETQPEEITPSTGTLISALMAPYSVIAEACEQVMSRIKKAIDRPPDLLQSYDGAWPPADGRHYIESDAFGALLLKLVDWLRVRYFQMDFSSALAHVFVWFDGKLEEDPDFISIARFKTPAAFTAYVRQALWNAARLTERERQRYEKRLEPLDLDREVPAGGYTPEQEAALAEEIDTLPPLHRTILDRMLRSNATLESLARELDLTVEDIVRIIDEAADSLIASSHPKRPRKKGRG